MLLLSVEQLCCLIYVKNKINFCNRFAPSLALFAAAFILHAEDGDVVWEGERRTVIITTRELEFSSFSSLPLLTPLRMRLARVWRGEYPPTLMFSLFISLSVVYKVENGSESVCTENIYLRIFSSNGLLLLSLSLCHQRLEYFKNCY